jgi:hypothetical protein
MLMAKSAIESKEDCVGEIKFLRNKPNMFFSCITYLTGGVLKTGLIKALFQRFLKIGVSTADVSGK